MRIENGSGMTIAGRLLLSLDLTGTAVFAVEGALAAIGAGLDVFGIFVLAFVTALGGGIVRDVLIGSVPPAGIRDWRYSAVAFMGAAAAWIMHAVEQHATAPVDAELIVYLDAAGLGLFAVAGAQKAIEYHLSPFIAVLLGGVTGAGGGVVRDVLLAHVPVVLRADVYATAALAGAAIMLTGRTCGLPQTSAALLGAGTCFVLRVTAVAQHWNLPTAAAR